MNDLPPTGSGAVMAELLEHGTLEQAMDVFDALGSAWARVGTARESIRNLEQAAREASLHGVPRAVVAAECSTVAGAIDEALLQVSSAMTSMAELTKATTALQQLHTTLTEFRSRVSRLRLNER